MIMNGLINLPRCGCLKTGRVEISKSIPNGTWGINETCSALKVGSIGILQRGLSTCHLFSLTPFAIVGTNSELIPRYAFVDDPPDKAEIRFRKNGQQSGLRYRFSRDPAKRSETCH
jgi:hypothetical protein